MSTYAMQVRAARTPDEARRTLLPYFGIVAASSAITQIVISVRGHHIDALAGVLVTSMAIGYAVYLLVWNKALGQLRYGRFVAHALTYAAVNVGFLMHAYVLVGTRSPAIAGHGAAIDAGWIGAAMAMPALWGIGLLAHGMGSLLGRGFEGDRP